VRESLIRRSAPISPTCPTALRELRPPRGLAIRRQVELASVIGSVAVTAQGGHAERIAGSRRASGDHAGRIHSMYDPTGDAGPTGDGGPLPLGCDHCRRSLERLAGREAVSASSFLVFKFEVADSGA
jgi:hypothetical protein